MKLLKISIIILLIAMTSCKAKKDQPVEPTPEQVEREARLNLFSSILEKDYENVRRLISDGTSLQVYDENGYSPLMRAVQLRDGIMTEILIAGGAKIFFPHLNDTQNNASLMVSEDDLVIKNLLNRETIRLFTFLETTIVDANYNEAMAFVQDNYLSLNRVTIEGTESFTDFTIREAEASEPQAGTFVKFVVTNGLANGMEIENFVESLTRVASLIKDSVLLDYLIDLFRRNNISSELNIINADDINNAAWVIEKIRLLNRHSFHLNLDQSKNQLIALLTGSNTTNSFLNTSKEVVSVILENEAPSAARSQFVYDLIRSYFSEAPENLEFLSFAKEIIQIWGTQNLPQTGFQLDPLLLSCIEAIENRDFTFTNIEQLIQKLTEFAGSNEPKSRQSIEKVIRGNFSEENRTNLLSVILRLTPHLPDNITSVAIEENNLQILNLLLNDPLKVAQSDQTLAILVSVRVLGDSFTILGALRNLQEAGVDFSSQQGALALEEAFLRFWNGNNDFSHVTTFFLDEAPEILRNATEETSRNLLIGQLSYLRENETNGLHELDLLLTAINRINTVSLYERESFRKFPHPVKTTLLWDYIDIIVNAYDDYEIDYQSWARLIPKFLNKLPNETASFYKAGERENFNQNRYITQNTLQLVTLFYLGSEIDEDNLINPHPNSRHESVPVRDVHFSWRTFLDSQYFKTMKRYHVVWRVVIEKLLESERVTVGTSVEKVSTDFIDLLVRHNLFDTFPGLIDRLGDMRNKVPLEELSCFSLEALDERMDRPMGNWLPVKPIISIRVKTCSPSVDITDNDLKFLEKYIEAIMVVPTFDIAAITEEINSTSSTGGGYEGTPNIEMVPCDGLHDWESSNFSGVYSDLGIIQSRVNSDTEEDILNKDVYERISGQECSNNKHDETIQTLLHRRFVTDLMECAIEKELPKLIRYFESISERYLLGTDPSGSVNIGICRW